MMALRYSNLFCSTWIIYIVCAIEENKWLSKTKSRNNYLFNNCIMVSEYMCYQCWRKLMDRQNITILIFCPIFSCLNITQALHTLPFICRKGNVIFSQVSYTLILILKTHIGSVFVKWWRTNAASVSNILLLSLRVLSCLQEGNLQG